MNEVPSMSEFAGTGDTLTAGALLRRAREAAGLHVAALAVSLKVPVRKLEALEEDRWDVLPDAVFARALASSVCRTLKIDPQPVLERLPQMATPRLLQSGGINTPFRAPGDGSAPAWLNQLSKPVFLVVIALLLGALVLMLLPSMQRDEAVAGLGRPAPAAPAISVTKLSSPAEAVAVSAAPAATPPASGSSLAASPMPAAGPASAVALASSTARTAAGAATAAHPASSSAALKTADAIANAPAAAASAIIVFRTTKPSWVEVKDAKGAVPVRRVLAAGEAASAAGALPLQVVIGRVDATQVQVRGKPLSLRTLSHDNVARFEVK
jgi:cytoskeleton protein RodZ